jgi:hypothetical protein
VANSLGIQVFGRIAVTMERSLPGQRACPAGRKQASLAPFLGLSYNGSRIFSPPWMAREDRPLRSVAKSWHLLPHDRGEIERLASSLRIPPIVAQLLINRGLTDPEAGRRLLLAPAQRFARAGSTTRRWRCRGPPGQSGSRRPSDLRVRRLRCRWEHGKANVDLTVGVEVPAVREYIHRILKRTA